MMTGEAIHVTRALLPAFEVYTRLLEQVFATRHLTNHGALCARLEKDLAAWLGVNFLTLCANGTLALQLALHLAGLAGKRVITTPFSYVATVSALLWTGCTPVFADIDEETLCLDPVAVAAKIDADTEGIVPVHPYGNICDVDAFERLATDAGLRVLYDAAQCFGGLFRGKSVLDYGEWSIGSLHATKVFHAVEGGCVVSHCREDREKLELLRACGHRGDTHVLPGINAKLSELHAAMGLSLLGRTADNIAARGKISRIYDALLPSSGLRRPRLRDGLTYNNAYYPVIFDDEKPLLRVVAELNRENTFPRRYFFPALNTLPYLPERHPCPVAESMAKRVLCLPLYAELGEATAENIAAIIRRCI
jgi:dTDP-4-amino-4,6-dideoxygalactose transaminase